MWQYIRAMNFFVLFVLSGSHLRSLQGTSSALAAPSPVHGIQYTKNLGPGSEPADKKMKEKVGFLLTDAQHVIDLMTSTIKKAMNRDGRSRKIVQEFFNVEVDMADLLTMVQLYDGSTSKIIEFDLKGEDEGTIMADILGNRVMTTKGFWDLTRQQRTVAYIHELCHHQGGTDYWAWLNNYVIPVIVAPDVGDAHYLVGYAFADYWTIKAFSYGVFYMNADAWRAFAHYVLMLEQNKTGNDLYLPDLLPFPHPGSSAPTQPAPNVPYGHPPPRQAVTHGIMENPYGVSAATGDAFTYQDALSIAESYAGDEESTDDQGGGSKKKKGKKQSKEKKKHKKSSSNPAKAKKKKQPATGTSSSGKKPSIREKMLKYIAGQQTRPKRKK